MMFMRKREGLGFLYRTYTYEILVHNDSEMLGFGGLRDTSSKLFLNVCEEGVRKPWYHSQVVVV